MKKLRKIKISWKLKVEIEHEVEPEIEIEVFSYVKFQTKGTFSFMVIHRDDACTRTTSHIYTLKFYIRCLVEVYFSFL